MKFVFNFIRNIFKIALNFRVLIISLTAFFIFFSFYNRFLLDASTYNLSTAMREFSTSSDPSKMFGINTVITNAIIDEMVRKQPAFLKMAEIQTVRNFVLEEEGASSDEIFYSLAQSYSNDKLSKRNKVFGFLDKINHRFGKAISKATNFVLGRGAKSNRKDHAIPLTQRKKIKHLISTYQLDAARDIYENFVALHPNSDGAVESYIGLGYIAEISGDLTLAKKNYQYVITRFPHSSAFTIAQNAIRSIKSKQSILKKMPALLKKYDQLIDDLEKQTLGLEIGDLYLQLYQFENAIKFYEKSIDYGIDIAAKLKAQYNLAWIYKFVNNPDKALSVLHTIKDSGIESDVTLLAQIDLMRHYFKNKELQKGLNIFRELFAKNRHTSIGPMLLHEVAQYYLYIYNNPIKTAAYFDVLKKLYPKSKYIEFISTTNPNKVKQFLALVQRLSLMAPLDILRVCSSSFLNHRFVKFKVIFEEQSFNSHMNMFLGLGDKRGGAWDKMIGGLVEFDPEKNRAYYQSEIHIGEEDTPIEVVFAPKVKNGQAGLVCKKVKFGNFPIPTFAINFGIRKGVNVLNKIDTIPYYFTKEEIVFIEDEDDPDPENRKRAILCEGYVDEILIEDMRAWLEDNMGGDVEYFPVDKSEMTIDSSLLLDRYPQLFHEDIDRDLFNHLNALSQIYTRTIFEAVHNLYNVSWHGNPKHFDISIPAFKLNYHFNTYIDKEYPYQITKGLEVDIKRPHIDIEDGMLFLSFEYKYHKKRIDFEGAFKIKKLAWYKKILTFWKKADIGFEPVWIKIDDEDVPVEIFENVQKRMGSMFGHLKLPIIIKRMQIKDQSLQIMGSGDKNTVNTFISLAENFFDVFMEGEIVRKKDIREGRQHWYQMWRGRYLREYREGINYEVSPESYGEAGEGSRMRERRSLWDYEGEYTSNTGRITSQIKN